MRSRIELSIVIPAYNEQDRIVPTLRETLTYLGGESFEAEILIVSDGSKDRTAEVARRFAPPANVRLHALEYHPNRGKGYAVRYGMLRAEGRNVLFMDADYAVPIHYCQRGMEMIADGADIAIASRAIAGARIHTRQNFFRSLSAKIYTLIQNTYLGIDYPDTQCGFKLFRQEAARELFKHQKLNSVIFDPEILWLAKRHGYSVAQFAVYWTHIGDSRIQYDSLRKNLFVFQELFRIKKMHRCG